jgi:hypothetical protein
MRSYFLVISIAPRLARAKFAAICGGLLLQAAAVGADIVLDKPGANGELVAISITGEIQPGDDLVFARLAKGAKQIWLNLKSPGGDVDAAIGIGSEVRTHDGIVVTDACYSSCVLIFAGGVTRTGSGLFDDPVVGVHRIFFADLQAGLTSQQVKAMYDAHLKRIRTYLAKMNVAPELLSFMQSIEPADVHVLTQKELARYGLGASDVIYNERMVADRAEELGLSSLEYRIREKRSSDALTGVTSDCKDIAAEPSEDERSQAARLQISVDKILQADCALAIHYGISFELYRQRSGEVSKRCSQFTDQTQNNRCEMHFMTTGRAVP